MTIRHNIDNKSYKFTAYYMTLLMNYACIRIVCLFCYIILFNIVGKLVKCLFYKTMKEIVSFPFCPWSLHQEKKVTLLFTSYFQSALSYNDIFH